MRINYATKKWQKKMKNLKGSRKAFKKLKVRKNYSAAWRRAAGTKSKPGRKTKTVSMGSKPSRKQMFSCNQVEDILEAAAKLVKRTWRSWVPVSKAPNHVQSKAREAFEQAAFKGKVKPAHMKVPLKRTSVKTHWFKKVVNQSFDVSVAVKRRMKSLYNNLTKEVLQCERKWKNRKS